MTQWQVQPDGIHVQLNVPCTQGEHPMEVCITYQGNLELRHNPCLQLGEFSKMTDLQCQALFYELEAQFPSRILLHALFHDYLREADATPQAQLSAALRQATGSDALLQQPAALPVVQALRMPLTLPPQEAERVAVQEWGSWAQMVLLRRWVDTPEAASEWVRLLPAEVLRSLPRVLVSLVYASVLGDEQAARHFLEAMQRHELEDVREWALRQEGKLLLGLPLEDTKDGQQHALVVRTPTSASPHSLCLWLRKAAACPDNLWDILFSACKVAADLRLVEAVEPLMTIARQTDNRDLRLAAIEALGRIGDASAAGLLIEYLGIEDYAVRQKARLALSQIKSPECVRELVGALQGGSAEKRRDIYLVLGALGGAEALAILCQALAQEEEVTRYFVCLALGTTGDPAAIEAIQAAAKQGDEIFQNFCFAVAKQASQMLCSSSAQPSDSPPQESHMRTRETSPVSWRYKDVVYSLREHLLGLYHPNPDARITACAALKAAGHDAAVPALIEALYDKDEKIVIMACKALAPREDPAALERLLELFTANETWVGTMLDGTLLDFSQGVAEAAFKAIARVYHPSVKSFLESLEGEVIGFCIEDVCSALAMHGWTPSPTNPYYYEGYDTSSWLMYEWILDDANSAQDIRQFLHILTDDAWELSEEEASLLQRACDLLYDKGVDAIPVFDDLLQGDLSKSVEDSSIAPAPLGGWRCRILYHLLHLSDPLAIPVLLSAINNSTFDRLTRRFAQNALFALGEKCVCPDRDEALEEVYYGEAFEEMYYCASKAFDLLEAVLEGDDEAYSAVCEELREEGICIVSVLVEALQDSNAEVRRAACEALGAIGDASAVPALTEALHDSDSDVRCAACEALGRIGADAVPVLVEALKHSDWEVREKACEALKQIGVDAVPALVEALKDSDAEVRCVACEALGAIGSTSAVPALIRALQDSEWEVCYAAREALGAIGADAVPALVEALKHSDAKVREMACELLEEIGDASAVPALTEALQDSNAEVRRAACEALKRIGDASAVPALTEALRDSDIGVRRAACELLKQIGDASAVPALTEALEDSDAEVRRTACRAIRRIGDASAVPALIEALKDNDTEVRRVACEALGKIGSTSAVPALTEALKDSDTEVRRAACWALGKLGTASAMPALTEALKDSDTEVRRAACWALVEIVNNSTPDDGILGDSVVPALIQALQDNDAEVRTFACEVLARMRERSAVPAIIALLSNSEMGTRRMACWALGEIGDTSAVPALITMLDIPDVRYIAREALRKLGCTPAQTDTEANIALP